jgi:GT2 family glycosyltransferase
MERTSAQLQGPKQLSSAPTVTIVVLVYNRREELRRTLHEMLGGCDYDPELVDVVVVDNASEDGSSEMVRSEFPEVKLIRREVNCGISGWNDGFEAATGELVLILDDDCYLPGDGLSRAVAAMQEHEADMVSFAVTASTDPDYRFDLAYKTGLLTFWGCAALVRREVLDEIGGFDPKIFVWAHEVEFMMRFYDRGYRHLHLPEVIAVHMKDPSGGHGLAYYGSPAYRFNAVNFGYVVARHLRARDAAEALVALLALNVRHAIRIETAGIGVVKDTIVGFARGLRNREPLQNKELSRTYRRDFYSFAGPWRVMRGLRERMQPVDPNNPPRPTAEFYEARPELYPDGAASLKF